MASAYSSHSAFSTCFHLFTTLLVWLLLQSLVVAQNRRDEVRTLISFKNENVWEPDYGYWVTWRETDENPCAWVGVACTVNSTVSELDLSGWGFDAINFSVSLGVLSNLRDLRQLDLSSNSLVDRVDIGNLTGLTLLNLSSTDLQTFPDFGNLTGLSVLDLSLNSIGILANTSNVGGMSGEIPPGISASRGLRSLSLQGNCLDSGISNLRKLVNLQILLLADNSFSGSFPQELGELTSLVTLDLSYNSFNGTILTLPKLSKLVYLNLDNNNFTEFETDWLLGANSTLCQLSASYNQIGGIIPSSMTKLLKLQVLNMSGNRLSGAIPVGFSRLLGNRGYLDLSQNQLTGKIPADMLVPQSGPLLRPLFIQTCGSVNLSRNLLTGSIPPPMGGTDNSCFRVVDFSHNNLRGPFPWSILWKIVTLRIQNNQLSGDIVDGVLLQNPGRFGSPVELQVQNNLFTGDLSRIVNLDQLRFPTVLDLSNNDLRWTTSEVNPDPIQATLETIASSYFGLMEFRAGGNNFSGTSLPRKCFSNHSSAFLYFVDLSNSHLHGEIMSAAFNSLCLESLDGLNLSNNHITGPVPASIVTIPLLTVLDVSNNHLSGPIPTLPFNSSLTNRGFFEGNDGLCGAPLGACSLQGSGVPWWVLLVSITGTMTVALISCLAVTWRLRVYHRMHQQDADLIKTLMERDSATLMPLRELRKATDNFAEKAQIGQGGFGTVYMGKLNDGTTVAIKRSKREGSDKDKEQFLMR